jgi:hypothetical protein
MKLLPTTTTPAMGSGMTKHGAAVRNCRKKKGTKRREQIMKTAALPKNVNGTSGAR